MSVNQAVKRKYDDIASSDKIKFYLNDEKISQIRLILKGKTDNDIAYGILDIELELCQRLSSLEYPSPVSFIYNPIDYAANLHCEYLSKYGLSRKKILFVGMNPGPFGMAQTGVPFGEVETVKNWFKIQGDIEKPQTECPNRKITGLECKRNEVSGERFWGLFKMLCNSADKFFEIAYVHNFCPLLFLKESGKNVTPVQLKSDIKKAVSSMCLNYLSEVIKLLNPIHIIGVGKYAKDNIEKACKLYEINNVKVSVIMHPSPASPKANKGWKTIAIEQLKEIGVLNLFSSTEISEKL